MKIHLTLLTDNNVNLLDASITTTPTFDESSKVFFTQIGHQVVALVPPTPPTPAPQPVTATQPEPVAPPVDPKSTPVPSDTNNTKKVVRVNDSISPAQTGFINKLCKLYEEATSGHLVLDALNLPDSFDFQSLNKGQASDMITKLQTLLSNAKAINDKNTQQPVTVVKPQLSDRTDIRLIPAPQTTKKAPLISQPSLRYLTDLEKRLAIQMKSQIAARAFVESKIKELTPLVPYDQLTSAVASHIIDILKVEINHLMNTDLVAIDSNTDDVPF